jgi:hypothetical protein
VADFIGEAALVPVERSGDHSVHLRARCARARAVPQGKNLVLVVRSSCAWWRREHENAFPVTVQSRVFRAKASF